MSRLTGRQQEQLWAIIKDAFDLEGLRELLLFKLDKKLAHYTQSNSNFPAIILNVIDAAERDGWTLRLVKAIMAARPERRELHPRLLELREHLEIRNGPAMVNVSIHVIEYPSGLEFEITNLDASPDGQGPEPVPSPYRRDEWLAILKAHVDAKSLQDEDQWILDRHGLFFQPDSPTSDRKFKEIIGRELWHCLLKAGCIRPDLKSLLAPQPSYPESHYSQSGPTLVLHFPLDLLESDTRLLMTIPWEWLLLSAEDIEGQPVTADGFSLICPKLYTRESLTGSVSSAPQSPSGGS